MDSVQIDPVYTSYEDIPVMMTVEEFGRLMRVSRNTAYAFVRDGLVPTVKVGRQIRIYRGDILRLRNGQNPSDICDSENG